MPAIEHQPPTLPPGVTPVMAGRVWAWIWLQGKRNQEAAKRRRAFATTVYGTSIPHLLMKLLVPWKVHEYPGARRYLSVLCGVAPRTADGWLWKGKSLPPKHARRLLLVVQQHRDDADRLAKELEAYIAEADVRVNRPMGFVKQRKAGGKTG